MIILKVIKYVWFSELMNLMINYAWTYNKCSITEHFSLKLRILQDHFDLVEASVGSKRSVVQKKSMDLAEYSGKHCYFDFDGYNG